jgi:hypothetical protein
MSSCLLACAYVGMKRFFDIRYAFRYRLIQVCIQDSSLLSGSLHGGSGLLCTLQGYETNIIRRHSLKRKYYASTGIQQSQKT